MNINKQVDHLTTGIFLSFQKNTFLLLRALSSSLRLAGRTFAHIQQSREDYARSNIDKRFPAFTIESKSEQFGITNITESNKSKITHW